MPDVGTNGFLKELGRLMRLLSVEERLAGILFLASWFAVLAALPFFGSSLTSQLFFYGFIFLQALVGAGLLFTRFRRLNKAKASLERGRKAAAETLKDGDQTPANAPDHVDLFLAVPMDGFDDFNKSELYNGALDPLLVALNHFVEAKNLYCGCKFIKTEDNFDTPPAGYRLSNAASLTCERFMLIWPSSVATSALFELGIARMRQIPTVIFYRNEKELPYLLRGKKSVGNSDGWPVHFHQFSTLDDICSQIQEKGHDLFPERHTN
ncbi:MAG: hypothetical protein NXI03_06715 [Alphaproteobacteria bacterium]|uniref:hypothetical protein n=1 Tax=Maricaulis alexandrii TaxID=2570354 RepID=UPI001109E605|nr:hypothetical protein [Maricaulis alexandrii]MCR9267248.1 hypothetical protein [Alphaproteobacteria bacterium]